MCAAIQRRNGDKIKNDSVVYFGLKSGETGRVVLYSNVVADGDKAYFFISPKDSKIKFAEVLKQKYETIEALNKAWNAPYKTWDDFLMVDTFLPKTKASHKDMLKIYTIVYTSAHVVML